MALVFWLALSLALQTALGKISGTVVSRFHLSSKNEEFQHLVIDPFTGRLYAGASNALYQLEDQGGLTAVERYQTGPELDSPFCNYNGDCIFPSATSRKLPGTNKTLTNNYNQILLVYRSWNALIACGTLRQGVCTIHRLENISRTFSNTDRSVPVAANSINSTTVAFLGPEGADSPVLYVATTFTYDAYRDAFPALCTRSLSEDNLFQLVDPGDVIGQSGLMIRNEYRSDFRVFYVGGFHYGDHAYWVSVQRRSAIDATSPFVTKVLRVCLGDVRYETYSELPLECLGADNSQYNVMKAFHVGRLGLSDQGDDQERYLIGVFTKAADPWKVDPKQRFFHSAICAFSLKDIRAAFTFSLQRCNSGIGKWNLPHFGFDQKCYNITSQQQHSNHDSCQPLRIGAEMPATSAALITYFGPLLTSITAEIIEDRTVLFVGTNEGKLKKISLQTIKNGREYGEVQLCTDEGPGVVNSRLGNWTSAAVAAVNPDMVFDLARRHLYVMTKNELLKVAVDACGSYETCDTCLASNDPYCGWCTLENRCSRKQDCPSFNIQYGFLPTIIDDVPGPKAVCPKIEALFPMNASLQAPTQTEVVMTFNFLPPQVGDAAYRCLFDAVGVSAEFVAPKTLKCQLPSENDRPKRGDSDGDMVQIPLKIWSGASSTVFYEMAFTYFDCGAHKRCTSCIASKWPCHWCLLENKCTDTPDHCKGETVTQRPPSRHHKHHGHSKKITTAVPSTIFSPTADRRVNQCPHIDVHELPEVLLPNGQSFAIRIPVANLDKLKENDQFGVLECVMTIERKEIRVRGWLAEDGKTVTCDSHEYSYKSGSKNILADFSLQTATGAVIDQMKVQIYKCESLGPDCTRCRNIDRRYHCGWCNNRCQHQKSCSSSVLPPNNDGTCPAPTIRSVSPLAGPVEGGTRVEILGFDLGYRREDVDGRISIGGRVLCDVVEYTASERIVCITRAGHEFEGPIEIRLANNQQRVSRSEQPFRYVQPTVDGFYPHIGPRSGGTEVIVSGTYLLDATQTEVYIGMLPCKLDRFKSTSERLVCKTSPSYEDRRTFHDLTVTFDRANRTLNGRFDYTPDPRVHSIQPLITFKSGGRQLIVRGKHFNSVQRPLMFFLDRQNGRLASENSICQVFNSTLMLCPSPALLPNRGNRLDRRTVKSQKSSDFAIESENDLDASAKDEPVDLSAFDRFGIGFIMDSVESLKRLDDFMITVVIDPIYLPFPNGRKLTNRGDLLVLEGTNLNLSSSDKDVRVSVGGELCNISLISSTRLVCQPPYDNIDKQRSKLIMETNVLDPDDVGPLVVVRVGYLEFVIGRLVYEDSDSASMLLAGTGTSGMWDATLIGAVVGVCVSLSAAAAVAIAMWWRKRMWQAEKEYERVRQRMDSLESNVRQECKQAFAELQTDISDLVTCGVGSQGIPYQLRAVYAEKIVHQRETTVKPDIDWQEYEEIMGDSVTSFEELLARKEFVSALIDVLEREHTIGSSDRVHVAGLLTASMATNMWSLTELLLMRLKNAMVEKTHGKFKQNKEDRPSITDSLMINWVSLNVYDYLIDSGQGKALFLVHKALKVQTEKGPVDAVTGHARFSLAEENLLKDQIDFEAITLRIIPPSIDSNNTDTIPCRVLTCDTIGQVKSKILDTLYKNAPFSSRPSVDDIELEWRSSHTRTGIFLQDDVFNGMGTVSCNDHWRQLNTLQHYGIHNNAVVAVFIKMRSNGPYADDSNTYMSISSSTYLLAGSSASGTSSPNGIANGSSKVKRYSSASTQWPRPLEKPIGSIRYWHMIKPSSIDSGFGSRSNGSVPEIYFTRLLATKGTVQQFIDDFFGGLFTSVDSSFPAPLKFLFDFVDGETIRLGLNDPNQVAHTWKTGCYFLKFWSHLIRNFDSLFDVERKSTLQTCMGVIDQVLADMCTYPEERLCKDTPSNKLLFARDLSRYRHMLARFVADVGRLPPVAERDLQSQMAHFSKMYGHELHKAGAVQELFTYAVRYREQVLDALSVDPNDTEISALKQRFEEISLWAGRQSVV